jgi:hypothetical protein
MGLTEVDEYGEDHYFYDSIYFYLMVCLVSQ